MSSDTWTRQLNASATEFRPCYKYVAMVEKPHSATYLFTTEDLVQAFVRVHGTR